MDVVDVVDAARASGRSHEPASARLTASETSLMGRVRRTKRDIVITIVRRPICPFLPVSRLFRE
jgi:hypothetical protein